LIITLLIGVSCLFTLPSIPVWEARRDAGLSLFGCLILWCMAIVQLRHRATANSEEVLPLAQAA
jgi:hypothetical protein